MAFLLSIYFGRADNPDNVITLTFAAWGWKRTALAYVHIIVSWFLLVYPVWRVERSFFFRICAVCMLFGPSFFIGCLPGNEETDFNPDHNVLWFNYNTRVHADTGMVLVEGLDAHYMLEIASLFPPRLFIRRSARTVSGTAYLPLPLS
ncbi:MAG: hypothetical protein LIO63_07600 [Akkermansia sp.]|nr:hypothetical protein [Akkermansia sp.]